MNRIDVKDKTRDENGSLKKKVKNYWETQPLGTLEISTESGSPDFYKILDQLKRAEGERFAMDFWKFQEYEGKRVLDVGCGPGWFSSSYAKGKARVVGMDITWQAARLAKGCLQYHQVSAPVCVADAEQLPFKDSSLDLVCSSGVLHHTPDMRRAIQEIHRVLRPGCRALISLYKRGIFHSRILFPIVRRVLNWLSVRPPGRENMAQALTPEEFTRYYDGTDNPLGVALTPRESEILVKPYFRVRRIETHYFPARFFPLRRFLITPLHWLLDRTLGLMIYLELEKPLASPSSFKEN